MPPAMDSHLERGGRKIISPTAIGARRPKSSRSTNSSRSTGPAGAPGTPSKVSPASQTFQQSFQKIDPKLRNAPQEGATAAASTPRFIPEEAEEMNMSSPAMCSAGGMVELLNFSPKAVACYGQTLDTSQKVKHKLGPPAKRSLVACADGSSVVAQKAGDGLTQFTVTASEAYRQECRSDNRGEDAMFFANHKKTGMYDKGADNSVIEHSTDGDDDTEERRDSKAERSSMRQKHHTPKSSKSRSSRSHNRRNADDSIPKVIHSTHGTDGLMNVPPKTSRNNGGDLREARMELFRLNGNEDGGGSSVAESRLSRALGDMDRQDRMIEGLKTQLRQTQKHLDETFAELQDARTQGQGHQLKATEARARSGQERKRLEDLYETETKHSKDLQEKISQLQLEVTTLRTTLSKKGEASKDPRGLELGSSSSSNKNDGTAPLVVSNEVIDLKAVIIELRSKLADVVAASGEENSKNGTKLVELRKKLQQAEFQVKEEKSLKEIVERVQETTEAAKRKIEEQLSSKELVEKHLRAELVKTTATLHRLERERSRKRLHSSADVDFLKKQLNKANEEVIQLRKDLQLNQQSFTEEIKALRQEIDGTTRQLSPGHPRSLAMKDKRKVEIELAKKNVKVKELTSLLECKEKEIATKVQHLTFLEEKIKHDDESRSLQVNDAAAAAAAVPSVDEDKIASFERQITLHKANEATLRADLKFQQMMLSDAKAKLASQQGMKTLDQNNIGHLQAQLQQHKSQGDDVLAMQAEIASLRKQVTAAETKAGLDDESKMAKAMEQSYKSEISSLKFKLSAAEVRCKEERTRTEEERRQNLQRDLERAREVASLKQAKDLVEDEKTQLQTQLASKQHVSNVYQSRAVAPASPMSRLNASDMEVPSNVKRLRSELAQARARLAAARDQTRALDMRDRPLVDEEEPEPVSENQTPVALQKSNAEALSCVPKPSLHSNGQAYSQKTSGISRAIATNKKPCRRSNVENLNKELEASRKRLQDANAILDSLQTRAMKSATPVSKIIVSDGGGLIDEVVQSQSGSIEVNSTRFADV